MSPTSDLLQQTSFCSARLVPNALSTKQSACGAHAIRCLELLSTGLNSGYQGYHFWMAKAPRPNRYKITAVEPRKKWSFIAASTGTALDLCLSMSFASNLATSSSESSIPYSWLPWGWIRMVADSYHVGFTQCYKQLPWLGKIVTTLLILSFWEWLIVDGQLECQHRKALEEFSYVLTSVIWMFRLKSCRAVSKFVTTFHPVVQERKSCSPFIDGYKLYWV